MPGIQRWIATTDYDQIPVENPVAHSAGSIDLSMETGIFIKPREERSRGDALHDRGGNQRNVCVHFKNRLSGGEIDDKHR